MKKILKFLTASDILILGGFGLINPIFAIFINDDIVGGSILAAGIATMIFEFTKALIQIPISKYTDMEDGNKREFLTLLLGSLIIAAVPLLYMKATNINQIYYIQFALGVGGGLSYPGWMTIFTKCTEKGKEGYNWSFYNTCVTFAIALAALVGGFMAENYGFGSVFALLLMFALLSIVLILKMHKYVLKEDGKAEKNKREKRH